MARVVIVGKTDVVPPYFAALKNLMSRMGMMEDDVRFTGHVDWPELVAYYKGSDVFLSMSEHEGFCVPLVESMICGTPVVAYSSTAVPYTLGDAGVQFKTKDYEQVAAVCHRLGTEQEFRTSVLQTQAKQLEKYSQGEIEKAAQQFLEPLL
jgi:glycosyltransferase involved in cell wall biosynthesis